MSEPDPQAPEHGSQNWTHASIYTGLSATAAEAAYCSKGTAHTYNCLFPTAYTPKISKSQQIYHCLSMTHRQCPQQIGKNCFKGPVLSDPCFPLETEYAKQAPGWRKQLSWDAEGKWWITSRHVVWENAVLQQHHAVIIKWVSYTLVFPTWVVTISSWCLGKLAIIHQCLPKLGQLLSSYSHSAGHKTIYAVLEAKCIPNKLPHNKTKGTTACDQKGDRDVPSCNQEQQALMKPHAVTAFRLQIKLNHSAAEAEIRVNLWPLSQGISGWQTLKNIPTFEICRDRLQMLLQTH